MLQPESIVLTGGVACNREFRQVFTDFFGARRIPVLFPRPSLTTDNAAMIAAAAYPKFLLKDFADPEFSAEASLALA